MRRLYENEIHYVEGLHGCSIFSLLETHQEICTV